MRRFLSLLLVLQAINFLFVELNTNTLYADDGDRPNILVAISDDQSYPHASAYGEPVIQTPGFDAVARKRHVISQRLYASSGLQPDASGILDRTLYLAKQGSWNSRQPFPPVT